MATKNTHRPNRRTLKSYETQIADLKQDVEYATSQEEKRKAERKHANVHESYTRELFDRL